MKNLQINKNSFYSIFFKKADILKKKSKIVLKLVSFFSKNGDVKGQLKIFINIFSNFFFFFNKSGGLGNNFNQYINTQEFIFILRNNRYYKNIVSMLGWVMTLNNSQFELDVQKVSKKYKKRAKKKYLYKIKYVSKEKQLNKSLK